MPEPCSVEFDRSRTYVEGAQSVLFFARRGERIVRCYVTDNTLAALNAEGGNAKSCAERSLRAFDAHADEVYVVARHMIEEALGTRGNAVVITSSDMLRHLNRASHDGSADTAPARGEIKKHG